MWTMLEEGEPIVRADGRLRRTVRLQCSCGNIKTVRKDHWKAGKVSCHHPVSILDRLRAHTTPKQGCLLWSGYCDQDGYGRMTLTVEGKRITKSVHRWAWEAAGLEPSGSITHTCGNRNCWNVQHLVG